MQKQTPVLTGHQSVSGQDGDGTPEEALPQKSSTQTEKHTSRIPRRKVVREESRKDITNKHITFEIPPSPAEVLSRPDLYALFSGAPVFSVLQKGNETPEPRVLFPFNDDEAEGLEGLSDCPPIAHPAFSLCTSRSHQASNPDTRERQGREDLKLEEQGRFVEEEPSMLSFMGLEPGSCGWEYFMMYPVGDVESLEEQDDEDQGLGEGGRDRGRRGSMGNGKGGIRSVETDYIVERLKELGEIWNEQKRRRSESSNIIIGDLDDSGKPKGVVGQYSSLELYTQLFTRLLYPPTRITTEDFHDPYSLKVQIFALTQTLALKKIWLDFKDVQWRIRLGQILWGSKIRAGSEEDGDNGDNGDNGEEDEEDENNNTSGSEAEKVWLLLQILLASELAVRLDAFFGDSTVPSDGPRESKEETSKRFKYIRTKKVEWDILLARRWLDNVQIIDDQPPVEKDAAHLAPLVPERRGWFSSRSAPPSPPPETNKDGDREEGERSYEALIYPRNPTTQFSGLMYFARCLQWPQLETLSQHLQEKIRFPSSFSTPAHSVSSTSLTTPLSMMSVSSNNYFQTIARPRRIQELSSAAAMAGGTQTRASALMKTMESGGWMSRTYLSGLILPGEGLSHFLISTLLENDTGTVDSLGYTAYLYSGFKYEDSTWWSSYCIVGKVLAGHGQSREVSGWIGPCLAVKMPTENGMVFKDALDGWKDIYTIELEDEEARVLSPHLVEEGSNPLGTKYGSSKGVFSSDFSMPKDDVLSDEQILVERLVLVEPQDDVEIIVGGLKKYEAELHFRLGLTGALAVRLRHDVFFITSFPCIEPLSSIKGLETDLGEYKKSSHPLHKEFLYDILSVESVVQENVERRKGDRTLVVEAGGIRRGREVLARAWCAERGTHAIIGGRGRTCLGCCIREARALGVWVVIRVE